MSTTSNVAFAEQWINHYKNTASPVSYQAFDFTSIKRSLIEYLKVYHPEYFNNLIETDELLPLIETFAYVGDLFSYRSDVNAQERTLQNVMRKSSAIQLANTIGYTTSRRVAGFGLVKIQSIKTTETIVDITGVNLRNRVIKWGDQVNPTWQTHFARILDRILNSQSGVVTERDKTSISGVAVERYQMNTLDIHNGILRFVVDVNGVSFPFEVVSAELQNETIVEQPPTGDRTLSLLRLNDGMGNNSASSGYFFLIKQGNLINHKLTFTSNTSNQVVPIATPGVNQSDVWLNELNSDGSVGTRWEQVDNVAYHNQQTKTVFQVETLEDDKINLIFGDHTYGNIPKGTFTCWVRESIEYDGSIPTQSIDNQELRFEYKDAMGNIQTASIKVSLEAPITTSSSSETIDKIKTAAPGVFYTQHRMVNAQDYQSFLIKDPSILKTKAVNRTFAGHSKYKGWYDGSQMYENVRIFGSDGTIYYQPDTRLISIPNPNYTVSVDQLFEQHIEPILSRPELWLHIGQRLVTSPTVRKYFTNYERVEIQQQIDALVEGSWLGLNWNELETAWDIRINNGTLSSNDIEIQLNVTGTIGWQIDIRSSRIVFYSATTKFWNYGKSSTRLDYDTTNPTQDKLVIVQSNSNKNRNAMLDSDITFRVVDNYVQNNNLPNQSLNDTTKIEIVGADDNGDVFPDDLFVDRLIGRQLVLGVPTNKDVILPLPFAYVNLADSSELGDIIRVEGDASVDPITWSVFTSTAGELPTSIKLNTGNNTQIVIYVRDFVYFEVTDTGLALIDPTDEVKLSYQRGNSKCIRRVGRSNLNFLWQHFTDQYELVDPAKTNINDLFVVTKGYYADLQRWLQSTDYSLTQPAYPTYQALNLAYQQYLSRSVLSDEVIIRPAKFKILFGPRSRSELRAKIQLVVRGQNISNITIKSEVVKLVRQYFDVTRIDFGQTFFFSDLIRYVATNTKFAIGSMSLIPLYPPYQFGDLYQIECAVDELFAVDISNSDIEIVENLTELNLRQ